MTVRYKKNDEIFTNITVVHYLLDEVGFVSEKDLSRVTLLEPASGEGSFALEIVTRLYLSSQQFEFDFIKALNSNIRFIELNKESIKKLEKSIKKLICKWDYSSPQLEDRVFICSNYLTLDKLPKFDCIVGNPPYIRHELIDASLKSFYHGSHNKASLLLLFLQWL